LSIFLFDTRHAILHCELAMHSLINFKMFTALSRPHMATRALELAHAEVDAEDLSETQFSGWRSKDAAGLTRRALSGARPCLPVVFRA